MSPAGCPKMSATPCNRNADESCPVLRLKSREQKSPTPLLIQDKDVLQPRLERTLRKKFPHSGARATKGKNKQVNLVRFADDFVITGNSKEVLEDEVKALV